jgi:hypothetical protein
MHVTPTDSSDIGATPAIGDQIFWSPEDVARKLGGLSRRYVYTLMDRGDLDTVPIGRRRMVPDTSLRAYVDRLHAEAKALREAKAGAAS